MEAIVEVKEKAKRVFGSRTHTKLEFEQGIQVRRVVPCVLICI